MTGEKILITGPAGQVAFPVARALAKDNDVVGIARFGNQADRERVEAAGIKTVKFDLAADSCDALDDDFTCVLNFAVAKSSDANFAYDLAANAEGAGRLIYHTRKAKAFLQCSSTAVYAYNGHNKLKESDPLGDSHLLLGLPTYSISKIASESVARFACAQWNVPTVIARLNVPFGDNGGWPAYHLMAMMEGQEIYLHSDKPNNYAPIHEDDIIQQIEKLLDIAAVPAVTLNWGGSEEVSIESWCEYLGELTGLTPKFQYIDQMLGSVSPDLTLMHQLIGKTTVPWREGMRRMVRARQPALPLRDAS
ncbi:MAG: NAD(P)-dependent oxidoreductase [Dehalococcoidia bacterium]